MSYIEQEITVGELREMVLSNEYEIEIDTPDGYQKLTDWYDKGELPMVRIGTENYQTTCAANHLLQTEEKIWLAAEEVMPGDKLLTESGIEEVLFVSKASNEECFDFTVDHVNHRYWGDGFSSHNSGKSYICSGNIIKAAQEQDIHVVLMDSENALDEAWLQALGVDTSEEKLTKFSVSMIDDVAKLMNMFIDQYKKDFEKTNKEEKPKVLFVIDSLGMMLTPTDKDQFEKGDMKGDMGRKAKMLISLCRNVVAKISSEPIGLVATNHTYASQDQFSPDAKVSGGVGLEYASSIIVAMQKLKLKEDEDGNKVTDVTGIRSKLQVRKSRFSKPFEKVEVKIPYETGMDPTSGLFDLLEKKGFLERIGNRYQYIKADGTEILEFKKRYTSEVLTDLLDDIAIKLEKFDQTIEEEHELNHLDEEECA